MYIGLDREQEENIGMLNQSDILLADATEEQLQELATKAALEGISAEEINTDIN